MDFRTPDRSRYHDPGATRREPLAVVPPPRPELQTAEAASKKRRLRKPAASRNWKKIAGGLVILAIIAWLAYGYITTKNQLEQAQNGPSAAGQTQTQQLVNKVSQLVDLPQGETPTIATVNDAAKLKSQAFFASAKDGDKVLIYSKAGKGVLYRPSTNKVIEYSSVNLSGTSTQ